MTSSLIAITDFGDLAVLLPIAVLIPLWLVGMRFPGAALWWLGAAALCGGGIAVLKIYFYACPLTELHSPSGHTSFSALVYGAIALMVGLQTARRRRMLVYGSGAVIVLAIAISRVLLGAHSPLEAVFGLVVGLGALAMFAQAYVVRRPSGVSLRPLLVSIALLLVVLHGHELHAEELLHAIGIYLQVASLACA